MESGKIEELERVASEVTNTLKDTTGVLSKRLDEGKVTLSAVSAASIDRSHHILLMCICAQLQAQKKQAPAAFEEVMAAAE